MTAQGWAVVTLILQVLWLCLTLHMVAVVTRGALAIRDSLQWLVGQDQLDWEQPATKLPAAAVSVLCWGFAGPFSESPALYLAAVDSEGEWRCDATGDRVLLQEGLHLGFSEPLRNVGDAIEALRPGQVLVATVHSPERASIPIRVGSLP